MSKSQKLIELREIRNSGWVILIHVLEKKSHYRRYRYMCERESDQKRKLVAAQSKQSSKCNFQSSDLFFKPLSQSKVFPELLKGGGEGHLF